MRDPIRHIIVVSVLLGLVGWALSLATSAQVDVGKAAYVGFGCFDCHGNFDLGGGKIADRDIGNPNALGGVAPAIVGWNVENLKDALYTGIYQEINYFKTREPGAATFTEAELSEADLKNITAYLNPSYADGNAAAGLEAYNETCFACHGPNAIGGAPFAGPNIQWKSFDVIQSVTRTGRLPERMSGLMPLYNNSLNEATVTAIAEYLQSINTWKPVGER